MLVDLLIRNFAIIDEVHVSFCNGLNLISGETGAGKSIIIGAISLLLGDRASADMIRTSEETAVVEASFDIRRMETVKEELERLGIDRSDELIIRRIIARSGKNRVFINGSMGNVSMLTALCEMMVTLCSQREHQSLLNKDNHIDILDDFGSLQALRKEYSELYDLHATMQRELAELQSRVQRSKEEEDLNQFQLGEIIEASLQPGEDELLLEERKIISHAQKLITHSESALETIYGRQGSVLEGLREALEDIRELKKIDVKANIDENELEDVYYRLEDLARNLRDYGKSFYIDPDRLTHLDERLELIGRLKRKYGGSLEDIRKKQEYLEKCCSETTMLLAEREKKQSEINEIKRQLVDKAELLSQRRKHIAQQLEKAVEEEIHTLRMEEASFLVKFQKQQDESENVYSRNGKDTVEFYLSANRGEDLKPLARIASGGELSRIMLAMKKVLAGAGQTGTIIFDEVDTGIGGAVASVVGEKLKDVSKHYQVICITHLPQIACFADRHLVVSKQTSGARTQTALRELAPEERLDELTRMLAGAELTETAREHARELLKLSSC